MQAQYESQRTDDPRIASIKAQLANLSPNQVGERMALESALNGYMSSVPEFGSGGLMPQQQNNGDVGIYGQAGQLFWNPDNNGGFSLGGNVGTSGQISGGGGGGGGSSSTASATNTGKKSLPTLTGGTGTGSSNPSFPGFSSVNGSQPGGFLPGQTVGGSPSGYTPGQVPSGGQQGPVEMTSPDAQSALQDYYNTPGYQLTEGQGAVDQFQTSPGYQFAVNEALKQVQGNAASRGLLDSGAALRSMTDRAQNMANQEYQNWQNRQQNIFNNYQNRLAGLAAGPTGSQYAMQTGQGLGAGALQTGNDIASLLANQGNTLFGGIINTGAAQAGNVSNAGAQQAQILGANQATNLAAAAQGLF